MGHSQARYCLHFAKISRIKTFYLLTSHDICAQRGENKFGLREAKYPDKVYTAIRVVLFPSVRVDPPPARRPFVVQLLPLKGLMGSGTKTGRRLCQPGRRGRITRGEGRPTTTTEQH